MINRIKERVFSYLPNANPLLSIFSNPPKRHALLPKKNCSLLEMINFLERTIGVRSNEEIAEIVARITRVRPSKAAINIANEEGITALMAFSHTIQEDIDTDTVVLCMQKLIQAGADLELTNGDNYTALGKVVFHYSVCQWGNITDGHFEYIPPDISKEIGRKPLTFTDLQHLLAQARVLLNAGAFLHDLPFSSPHAPSINLFDGSDLAKYNMLFLFLTDMSDFLKYKNSLEERSYLAIYSRLSDLVIELSQKNQEEKQENNTVGPAKSFSILYQEAAGLLKKIPYPDSVLKALHSIKEIDALRPETVNSIIRDYIGPNLFHFFQFSPMIKNVADEKNINVMLEEDILRYS